MTETPLTAENHFKRYIRSTLYAAIGRPPAPNLPLRGRSAIKQFHLPPHIEEQFGWTLDAASIEVKRDANGKIVDHGWRCVGTAVGEDLTSAMTKAGLEPTFFLVWSSDRRILSRHHHGPAVDVLKTQFTCRFLIQLSCQPDWDGLDEAMRLLAVAAELRSAV